MGLFGFDNDIVQLIELLAARIAVRCRIDSKTLFLWSMWEIWKMAQAGSGIVDDNLRRMIPTIVLRKGYRLYNTDRPSCKSLHNSDDAFSQADSDDAFFETDAVARFENGMSEWIESSIKRQQPDWRNQADQRRDDAGIAWCDRRIKSALQHTQGAALYRVLATRPAARLVIPVLTYVFDRPAKQLAAELGMAPNQVNKINSRFQSRVRDQATVEFGLLKEGLRFPADAD